MGNLICTSETIAFGTRCSDDVDVRVVHLAGELDSTVRDVVLQYFADGDHRNVVVDMAALTFMDCGGYRALVDASNLLGDCSASLTVANATGEPARLLALVGVNQSIAPTRTSQDLRRNP
jgi:anti-anti-sigma factor